MKICATKQLNKTEHRLLLIIKISICVTIASILAFFGYLIVLNSTLKLNDERLLSLSTPVSIYTNNNEVFSFGADSPYASLKELQAHTIDAFICVEDVRFYEHKGINVGRIAKAFLNNISNRSIIEGASTISQQLIKNTHLSGSKTYARKICEILLTFKLEAKYSKEQILEMYLNAIYFGSGCYGIESASNFYFNKKASQLTLNESAILSGIIKSPTYLSPINYPNECLERKNLVLKQMKKYNKISQQQYNDTTKQNIDLQIHNNHYDKSYDEYIISALNEASEILSLSKNSLIANKYQIYTYLDETIQDSLIKNIPFNQDVMYNALIIDNDSGGINGFVSSLQYGGISTKRTPASALKPLLVYTPAIEQGDIYFDSIILDEPTNFDGYTPQNMNNKYYGNITVSSALASSLNIPAIKILQDYGIDKAKDFATKLGITFDEKDTGLALALGGMTKGINIKDLCDAYSPFACNGYLKKSTFIKKIINNKGEIVYKHNPISKKVMNDSTAYIVGEMMEKTVTEGTCKALKSDYDIRAKTGTNGTEDSSLNTDMLCIAQTTKNTVCAWYYAQNNNKENLINTKWGLSPTIKLKQVFQDIYSTPPKNFTRPNTIIEKNLDRLAFEKGNILLAPASTPERYTIKSIFSHNNQPKEYSTTFTNVTPTQLILKPTENAVHISFTPLPYQIYELVRTQYLNGKALIEQVLTTISNTEDTINITDDTIKTNSKYTYHLKISQPSGIFINTAPIAIFTGNSPSITETQTNKKWYF